MKRFHLNKFGKRLTSRDLVSRIFSDLEISQELELDFGGIETVTPSFCHEMLFTLKQHKSRIRINNANPLIQVQLQKALQSLNNNNQEKELA